MASIARSRGIQVHKATAEQLPFDNISFDFALMITTLCFVEDPGKTLSDVMRILKPEGNFILGIIDRETNLGKIYESRRGRTSTDESMKGSDKFYSKARFYSTSEVIQFIQKSRFDYLNACQTIFSNRDTMTAPDLIRDDYGEGAFVVINSIKPS